MSREAPVRAFPGKAERTPVAGPAAEFGAVLRERSRARNAECRDFRRVENQAGQRQGVACAPLAESQRPAMPSA